MGQLMNSEIRPSLKMAKQLHRNLKEMSKEAFIELKESEDIQHDNVTWKKFELSLLDYQIRVSIDGSQRDFLVSRTWRESITEFRHWWMKLLDSTGFIADEKKDAFTKQASALRFSVSWENPYLNLTYLNQDESDTSALDAGPNLDADTVSPVEEADASDSEPLGELSDSDTPRPRRRPIPRGNRRLLPAPRRSQITITVDNSESQGEDGTEQRSSSASSLSASSSSGASEELSRSTTSIFEAARRFDGISSSSRSDGRMAYSDWRATLAVQTR
ncbi:hypothetical protein FFLO_03842 [Filobasidium floriforme]|uniref:Uncharacterized protein n=1 Tax=Filobasidium floriforme TaxID=5210 RepID=A0A8K0NMV6_9TREE|nr:uncharacterized protein HD553DRAFT_337678 [Filobasidium floriforme]KAG7532100.1 hypothetical protein FFLO_03842 [Filobasidium floriforme]KAH8078370.1 hypothetical protein HD553DRAFT_337678 [Filobasidium floriforme]